MSRQLELLVVFPIPDSFDDEETREFVRGVVEGLEDRPDVQVVSREIVEDTPSPPSPLATPTISKIVEILAEVHGRELGQQVGGTAHKPPTPGQAP